LTKARVFEWMSKGAMPTESVAPVIQIRCTADRFARFKKGEPVETLVEEAKAAEAKLAAPTNTQKK